MKTATTQDPIEGMMRQWLAIHVALAEGRTPPISMGTFLRGTRGLTQRVGDEGFERIITRLSQALEEIVAGAPAPPVAQMGVDGLTAVEADMVAEKLVAEYRRRGVNRTNDPNWRTELRRKWDLATERHIESLAPRRAKPAPLQRVTLPAEVTAQTRSADSDNSIPFRAFRFAWSAEETYNRGDVVQSGGAPYICVEPSRDKPGTSRNWRLLVKTDASSRKARAA